MDACHMLVGRPLQFDMRVIHDGGAIAYSLRKDGVRHTLKPLMKEAKNMHLLR